jgi:hypothetical protein
MCKQCENVDVERANFHWVEDEYLMTSAVLHPNNLPKMLPYYFEHMGDLMFIQRHDNGMVQLIRAEPE